MSNKNEELEQWMKGKLFLDTVSSPIAAIYDRSLFALESAALLIDAGETTSARRLLTQTAEDLKEVKQICAQLSGDQ